MRTPNSDNPTSSRVFRIIAICFVFSGATALIYEVLWARMLGLVFGATSIAISAVLTAFMGGLALGSAIAAKVEKRLKQPLRAYGIIEIGVGLYALIVPFLFRGIDLIYANAWQRFHLGFYGFAFARFALAALVLVAPTALMGATLPVLVASVRRQSDRRAAIVARLYALNLAGAIIGVVLAGFFLLPSFGVSKTIWIAAITNLAIGVAALLASRNQRVGSLSPSGVTAKVNRERVEGRRAFWILCAFTSGLATIGMQVVWSRVLSMIVGSSTYAFTIVLALFLIGLALGAWIVSTRATPDLAKLRRGIMWIEILTAATLFLSVRLTSSVPSWVVQMGFRLGINSWAGLLSMQIMAATALILLPAILMGMIMPLVLTWAGHAEHESRVENSSAAKRVGQSYAVNTIGAIAGAIVTTFLLIPMTSTRFTVFCAAALSIFVAGIAYEPRRQNVDRALARSLSIGAATLLMMVTLAVWPRLNLNALSVGAYDGFVRVLAKSRGGVPENEEQQGGDHQLLMYEEGRTATVSVRRDWGITSVAINGRTNASDTDDMPTQVMLGQLGVLTAPRLGNALIVGFATGVTAGSVLQSQIQSVECVEIEPAAIASSRFFEHVNNRPLSDRRLRVVIDDARTYLRVNPTSYDVIISEPSHPWVPGVANLFTREFFTLGRDRLRDDGVFVQWLQIYQLSTESLRSVLATFHEVFPHVAMFRIQGAAKGKDLILLGSRRPIALDRIVERMKDARVAADLNGVGLKTSDDVQAWFVCDELALGPAVASAVINTDDNMHVETVAPRQAFRPTMEENAGWIESLRLRKSR